LGDYLTNAQNHKDDYEDGASDVEDDVELVDVDVLHLSRVKVNIHHHHRAHNG